MELVRLLDWAAILRISDDALVIYAGLAAQLGACLSARLWLSHPAPLAAGLAAVLAATAIMGLDGIHGIAVGMAAPLFLFATARLAPGLFFRR